MQEMLYGRNPVYECLRAGRRQVFKLVVAEGARKGGTLAEAVTLARQRGVPVQTRGQAAVGPFGQGGAPPGHRRRGGRVSLCQHAGCAGPGGRARGAALAADPGLSSGSAKPGHAAAHGRGGRRARAGAARAAFGGGDAGGGERLFGGQRAHADRSSDQPGARDQRTCRNGASGSPAWRRCLERPWSGRPISRGRWRWWSAARGRACAAWCARRAITWSNCPCAGRSTR